MTKNEHIAYTPCVCTTSASILRGVLKSGNFNQDRCRYFSKQLQKVETHCHPSFLHWLTFCQFSCHVYNLQSLVLNYDNSNIFCYVLSNKFFYSFAKGIHLHTWAVKKLLHNISLIFAIKSDNCQLLNAILIFRMILFQRLKMPVQGVICYFLLSLQIVRFHLSMGNRNVSETFQTPLCSV